VVGRPFDRQVAATRRRPAGGRRISVSHGLNSISEGRSAATVIDLGSDRRSWPLEFLAHAPGPSRSGPRGFAREGLARRRSNERMVDSKSSRSAQDRARSGQSIHLLTVRGFTEISLRPALAWPSDLENVTNRQTAFRPALTMRRKLKPDEQSRCPNVRRDSVAKRTRRIRHWPSAARPGAVRWSSARHQPGADHGAPGHHSRLGPAVATTGAATAVPYRCTKERRPAQRRRRNSSPSRSTRSGARTTTRKLRRQA